MKISQQLVLSGIGLLGCIAYSTSASASKIIGVIDPPATQYSDNYNIYGWACQTGSVQSVIVHLYLGGPAGSGTIIKGIIANDSSETAVANACGSTGKAYRFHIPISYQEAVKYQGQKIYVHGISPLNTGNLLLSNSGSYTIPAPTKKNVVIIYADDLGWGHVGYNGQTKIQTPYLDQYAKQGIQFNNFYTSAPFCPPARNSLLTGKHTGESVWRAYDPAFGREATVAQMFRNYGYDTSVFGKWGMSFTTNNPNDTQVVMSPPESWQHYINCSNMEQFYDTIGNEFERRGGPVASGFDHFVGYMQHRDAHVYYHDSPDSKEQETPEHPFVGDLIRQDLFQLVDGEVVRFPTKKTDYLPDMIMDQAIKHLNTVVKSGKPFFMYLPSQLPHAELVDPPELKSLYVDQNGNSIFSPETPFTGNNIFYRHSPTPRATLARMISKLDLHVRRVVDELKRLGVYDNTVIIFSSDNGPHQAGGIVTEAEFKDKLKTDYFRGNGGMRGQKFELHEGGIKVPTLIFGGGIKPGEVNTRYAQYQIKDTLEQMLTGSATPYSFYPVLEGEPVPPLDYLYFQLLSPQQDYDVSKTIQAVIKGNWKLIRYHKQNPTYKLYDLNEWYEEESHDQIFSHCSLAKDMLSYMNQFVDTSRMPLGTIDCQ